MILYLFVVVGVLDLECNCHVALFGIDVSLNNNANLRPIAILVDVDIRIGIDLPRDLIQNNTQQRIFIGNVRRHENRQELCILSLSFCSIAKNVFIAKNTAGNIEFLVQELFCFSLQFFIIIYACRAGAVLAQNLSLSRCVLFQIALLPPPEQAVSITIAIAPASSRATIFDSFFIGVSLQSAFFVDMFLFPRKAFATIVAFLP